MNATTIASIVSRVPDGRVTAAVGFDSLAVGDALFPAGSTGFVA